MSSIISHLEILVGSSNDASDNDKHIIEDWKLLQKTSKGQYDDQDGVDSEDAALEQRHSVLDNYRFYGLDDGTASHSQQPGYFEPSSCVARLLQKPDVGPLLESLRVILSSGRGDDIISGELVEIIGFDDIDLVMDILKDRDAVAQELERFNKKDSSAHHLSQEEARRRMEKNFRENAARPLFSGTAVRPGSSIFKRSWINALILSKKSQKFFPMSKSLIPSSHQEYEEVIIPPAKTIPPKASERLLPVSELEPLARESFPGKTDVAMLTILRVINQHRESVLNVNKGDLKAQLRSSIRRDAFKIIYVYALLRSLLVGA
ncbi:hypothetical protein C0991_006705 [Blastosporella zonata]|nr:hypothetical protein C0991_006705 [Blastosporella zonata]